MFESDDFDQVLSQFEFPDLPSYNQSVNNEQISHTTGANEERQLSKPTGKSEDNFDRSFDSMRTKDLIKNTTSSLGVNVTDDVSNFPPNSPSKFSPKHARRKIINSLFGPSSKRKFPGPAGLLTGSLEDTDDENISHIELLSQDVDFSQSHLRRDIFGSPLWSRLLDDVKQWDLGDVDCIQIIKQQALSGNLRKRKAQTVTAFVETVDRSASDPLVILRDKSGSIKCTLHRDAWTKFSSYIASEFCAFVLLKPTVLTTGGAFKKHYLNITLGNIYAIYSSAVIKENDDEESESENKHLPEGYVKVYEEDFTVIKAERSCKDADTSTNHTIGAAGNDLLDGLDSSIFLDEIF